MASITDIDGLKPHHIEALRGIGIRTSDDLLDYGASSRGRAELSKLTGIGDRRVQEWLRRADLLRVPGVSVRYSNLLEAAGVDTVRQLRRCRPVRLHDKVAAVNEARNVVHRLPSLEEVEGWVDAARALPVVVR